MNEWLDWSRFEPSLMSVSHATATAARHSLACVCSAFETRSSIDPSIGGGQAEKARLRLESRSVA